MIVAVGGLVHEANAFAPPSTPADVIVIPPEKMLRAFAGTSTEISGFLDAAEGEIDREDLVPLGFAHGESGGMLDDDVEHRIEGAGSRRRRAAARPAT